MVARSAAGFTGLVMTAMPQFLGQRPDLRAAIGGQQRRRQVPADIVPQPLDRIEAGGLVEVIVHQHDVGQPALQQAVAVDVAQRAGEPYRASPPFQQARHCVEDVALIVDAEHIEPGEIGRRAGDRRRHVGRPRRLRRFAADRARRGASR